MGFILRLKKKGGWKGSHEERFKTLFILNIYLFIKLIYSTKNI